MTGRTIGHYEILDKLGEGGMGVVYKARDTRLNRFVAIKVLAADKIGDDERVRRFTQEARTASALNHPNIITIHDIASEGGAHFMVMEFVAGKTLDQLIPPNGMPLAEALRIATQMADALAAAATAGIIHRDIKPGNIMVTESGLVKVLDFGLAKAAERPAAADQATATIMTRENTIVGTASYMSPEQAEGKPLDPRSDIFSFGAVLYEMATGRRAFRGDTGMSVIAAVMRDDPQPPSQVIAAVPGELDRIVARCLRKDPARRFQSMADVQVALLELKDETAIGRPAARPSSAPPTSRRWIFIASLAGLLAAAIGFGLHSYYAPPTGGGDMRVVPFTSYTGPQVSPSFSPDGNQVAFGWNGDREGPAHIYVKLIGTDTPLQLTSGNAEDFAPAWAPDGKSIAFLRELSPSARGIYQVSPLGGAERRIAEIGEGLAQRLSWSADGKWLVATGRPAPDKPSLIFAISTVTGEKKTLQIEDSAGAASAVLSPDSSRLAYSRQGQGAEVFVVDLDQRLEPDGMPRRLPAPPGYNWVSAWTQDGREVLFYAGSGAPSHLFRIAANGRSAAREIVAAGEHSSQPAVAPRGNRLAFSRAFRVVDIWRIPILGPGKSGEPAPFLSSTRRQWVRPSAFSFDGRKIAFESDRSATRAIWVANADGSNPTLLSPGQGSPSWSPDGRWIAFDGNNKDGKGTILIISADGGATREAVIDRPNASVPTWSPDGKWIYYMSVHGGGHEIFRVPSGGGASEQITHNGGWAPQLSSDGKLIYFSRAHITSVDALSAAKPTELLVMPAEGGTETKVLDAVPERSWAVTPEGVWFLWSTGATSAELRFYDFRSKSTVTAAHIAKAPPLGLAISPDGRTLLYSQVDQQDSEILLIENFR